MSRARSKAQWHAREKIPSGSRTTNTSSYFPTDPSAKTVGSFEELLKLDPMEVKSIRVVDDARDQGNK